VNHLGPSTLPSAVQHLSIEPVALFFRSAHTISLRLLSDDSGQDLIEYALVAALVGVGVLGALRGLKNAIGTSFNSIGNNLTSSVS
jgi:pilus assembly protein Flp/PilA